MDSKYLSRLTSAQKRTVVDSGAFQNVCSDFVRRNVTTNLNEEMSFVKDLSNIASQADSYDGTGKALQKLLNDVGDLDGIYAQDDYQSAAEEAEVCVVEGKDDTFYFKWDQLDTVDYDSSTDAMIDFKGWAESVGLDLTNWRLSEDDGPVLKGAVEDDTANDFFESANEHCSDAQDLLVALRDLATAQGLTEVADSLEQVTGRYPKGMEKLFGKHLNKAFMSSQSNDSVQSAYENACNNYGLDPHSVEISSYWAVDSHFAEKLSNHGEMTMEMFGHQVWGRSTGGQSIHLDHVVTEICIELWSEDFDKLVQEKLPEVAAALDAEIAMEAAAEIEAKAAARAQDAESAGPSLD